MYASGRDRVTLSGLCHGPGTECGTVESVQVARLARRLAVARQRLERRSRVEANAPHGCQVPPRFSGNLLVWNALLTVAVGMPSRLFLFMEMVPPRVVSVLRFESVPDP